MALDYQSFLAGKSVRAEPCGFEPQRSFPLVMKPFQIDITRWACRRGRAAIFAGTGLGKTLQQLVWARAVADHTGGRVIVFAPLAVAFQTVNEAVKFGIEGVAYAACDDDVETDIVVTNYERRHLFDLSQFAGIVCDESSILKSQDSKTRAELMAAAADVPYKLCCTATPAPNDWTELGQHSEFLGVLSAKEMLAMFFVHEGSVRADPNGEEWRLKRHAERDFWAWLASWAVMLRSPNDLGYDEPGYVLPPLNLHQITVRAEWKAGGDTLFPMEARTMAERLSVKRDSVAERVACVANLAQKIWELTGARDNIASLNYGDSQCPIESTPSAAASDIEPIRNIGRSASLNLGPQKKIGNICDPTTPQTKLRGTTELLNSEKREISPDGSDMRPIENIEKNAKRPLDQEIQTPNERPESKQISASVLTNTPGCSPVKADAALYAEQNGPISESTSSTSITATKAALCAASYAQTVTSDLGSSKTASSCLSGQSSISQRVGVRPILVWCILNSEQDALEKAFGDRCFSVRGADAPEKKILSIKGWLRGERPVLISKPTIMGWGLNFQHCNAMVFVGLNDSFEQLFQSIRRCWRFGQTRPVDVYLIASELEGAVVANLRAKEAKYDQMANAMVEHMRGFSEAVIRGGRQSVSSYNPTIKMELPAWMRT